jgi:hypothetical protein
MGVRPTLARWNDLEIVEKHARALQAYADEVLGEAGDQPLNTEQRVRFDDRPLKSPSQIPSRAIACYPAVIPAPPTDKCDRRPHICEGG